MNFEIGGGLLYMSLGCIINDSGDGSRCCAIWSSLDIRSCLKVLVEYSVRSISIEEYVGFLCNRDHILWLLSS